MIAHAPRTINCERDGPDSPVPRRQAVNHGRNHAETTTGVSLAGQSHARRCRIKRVTPLQENFPQHPQEADHD